MSEKSSGNEIQRFLYHIGTIFSSLHPCSHYYNMEENIKEFNVTLGIAAVKYFNSSTEFILYLFFVLG